MILYHVTTARNAEKILRSGFRDATGFYLTDQVRTGVWFSDEPLSCHEGAAGDSVLEVRVDDRYDGELAAFEFFEEGKHYREWQIPVGFANGHAASVRMMSADELNELGSPDVFRE